MSLLQKHFMPWIICFKLSKMNSTQLFWPSLYQGLNTFYLHEAPLRKYVRLCFFILLPVKVAQILFLCYFQIPNLSTFCPSVVKNRLFCKETRLPKMTKNNHMWAFFLSNRREGVTFSKSLLYGVFFFPRNLKVLTSNLKWGIVSFDFWVRQRRFLSLQHLCKLGVHPNGQPQGPNRRMLNITLKN